MTGEVQNIGNFVDRWYKAEHYDKYPISKYTTYSNPSYLHNLKTSNEWYDWVLVKVRKDSIGTGGRNNDYGENSSYYASWREAHQFHSQGSGRAIEYLKELDMTLDSRPIPRHNQPSTKESDAFNTMKKMLLLWENKRRIEIPIEESQRVIQENENQKLQEIKNQEITFNEQQNDGDFNETPITEINFDNSCSECTGTKFIDPIPEKQLTENYLKIGGIAAVGVGILLLYTRMNKK
tara:strand:- start:113 stop:820 length:708 start_codon:yes stop_codon:yes gene_type:complete